VENNAVTVHVGSTPTACTQLYLTLGIKMAKSKKDSKHTPVYKKAGDISLGSGNTWTSTPYRDYADYHLAAEADARSRDRLRKQAHRRISIEQLVEKFNGICQECLKPVKIPTRDHIIAIADGGTSDISNIQLACSRCNSLKSSKQEKDKNKLIERRF
jgi:5-methylcytosine-specific restriction endonuclease McrA